MVRRYFFGGVFGEFSEGFITEYAIAAFSVAFAQIPVMFPARDAVLGADILAICPWALNRDAWVMAEERPMTPARRVSLEARVMSDAACPNWARGLPLERAAPEAPYCARMAERALRFSICWRRAFSAACLLSRSEVKNGAVELMPEKTSRARKKVSFLADPSLLPVLDSLPEDPSGLFFPDFAALFRKNNSALTGGFSSLLQKAGLPSGSMQLYALRHNFVTCQIDSGADLEDVSAAVGHVSTSTTGEFYYHGRRRVSLPGMAPI